jgi:hypothetical protein
MYLPVSEMPAFDSRYTARYTHRGRVDRHVLLDNIELVLLTLDEVVDGGCVLCFLLQSAIETNRVGVRL